MGVGRTALSAAAFPGGLVVSGRLVFSGHHQYLTDTDLLRSRQLGHPCRSGQPGPVDRTAADLYLQQRRQPDLDIVIYQLRAFVSQPGRDQGSARPASTAVGTGCRAAVARDCAGGGVIRL